mgnify:CR=1 FL=1
MIKSFQAKVEGLKGLSHVKTFEESVFLIILAIQFFFRKKLRINSIKSVEKSLITLKLDRLPSANTTPIGKETIIPTEAITRVSSKPPHRCVSTTGNRPKPPASKIYETIG